MSAVLAATLVAGPAEDMARIHVEAIGGPARIAALGAVKATGRVTTGGKTVRFHMIAARPNQVRLETAGGGRTLVQTYDGKNPPWEIDTASMLPVARLMREGAAARFMGDAEFDDPLIESEARGYQLDVAGEALVDERRVAKVLVTRNGGTPFFLLVDLETFFVVQRIDPRRQSSGRNADVVTRFDRFRPVDGVLLPHLIEVSLDGRVVQTTAIELMEANPKLDAAVFRRPESAEEKKDRDEKPRSKGFWNFLKKES
ncbi:MAG: hypothetical protein H7343_21765 [Undibacterium sp.]|nr:hypothetical protein [Opitutaceae bacterium]